jgi:hypothetical protein
LSCGRGVWVMSYWFQRNVTANPILDLLSSHSWIYSDGSLTTVEGATLEMGCGPISGSFTSELGVAGCDTYTFAGTISESPPCAIEDQCLDPYCGSTGTSGGVPGPGSCGACSNISNTLYLTITVAGCECANQSIEMVWDGVSKWVGDIDESDCTGGGSNQFWLECVAGNFRLRTPTATCISLVGSNMTIVRCEPLYLTLGIPNTPTGTCTECSAGTMNISITE